MPEDYMYEDSSEDGDGAMSETSRVTVSCAEEGAGSDEFDASAACDHDASREFTISANATVLSDDQEGLDDFCVAECMNEESTPSAGSEDTEAALQVDIAANASFLSRGDATLLCGSASCSHDDDDDDNYDDDDDEQRPLPNP